MHARKSREARDEELMEALNARSPATAAGSAINGSAAQLARAELHRLQGMACAA